MKLINALTAFAIAFTAQGALASDDATSRIDSRVAERCGADHVNEVASPDDVRANPDGFYVASLNEQVSLGDARIVFTTSDAGPYLCTRSAATPEMDTTNAILNADRRVTSWLFVPHHPMR